MLLGAGAVAITAAIPAAAASNLIGDMDYESHIAAEERTLHEMHSRFKELSPYVKTQTFTVSENLGGTIYVPMTAGDKGYLPTVSHEDLIENGINFSSIQFKDMFRVRMMPEEPVWKRELTFYGNKDGLPFVVELSYRNA